MRHLLRLGPSTLSGLVGHGQPTRRKFRKIFWCWEHRLGDLLAMGSQGTTISFLPWVPLFVLENRETPRHRTAQGMFTVLPLSDALFEHFGASLQVLPSSIPCLWVLSSCEMTLCPPQVPGLASVPCTHRDPSQASLGGTPI